MTRAPTRTGPAMTRVVEHVSMHPGQTQRAVARAAGPNGSEYFGYRAIRRALASGLIVAVVPDHGKRRERRLYPPHTPTIAAWGTWKTAARVRFAAGDVYLFATADGSMEDTEVSAGLLPCRAAFVALARAALLDPTTPTLE